MNKIANILESMEYGPAPEEDNHVRAWLKRHKGRFGHFVGGTFTSTGKGSSFAAFNPSNGEKLAEIAEGSEKDVDAAVKAATKAFADWSALSGTERARHLYALARQVQKHARFLAVLETLDNGKPIRETRDIDIPLVARHFYHHAGWAALRDEEFPGYAPAGVCGQVIPWNFPLLMLAWKVAPALAAGCTVVLKSAEHTPLTALAFAEICREASLPAGVFNLVNGGGRTGAAIVAHDGLAKIAFTGSTEVGRILRRQTAGTGKKLSLELGGKSPFIVFDNADIDAAIEGVVDAIWFNQGEVCCAGSRAIVQEGVADRFHDKLRARMETLRVGHPLDKSTDIGAVVAPVQIDQIRERVEAGVREGATLHQPSWANAGFLEATRDGCFFPPSLFTGVSPASPLAQEEIFGPVLVSMTFRTPGEAVMLANNSRYGLAASIWSQNLDTAFDTARRLKAGVVWINSTNQFDAAVGFGGYKESGFGREGGREGMFEYLVPAWQKKVAALPVGKPLAAPVPVDDDAGPGSPPVGLDRTVKMYVGGKQARPDSGYSYPVLDAKGRIITEAGYGNRKDIRNAVEAARKAEAWSDMTGHARAQVLYFLAENLELRGEEFAGRIAQMTGVSAKKAAVEVAASVARIIHYAARADKYDGRVRAPQGRMLALALPEPWEVIGISCPDEAPLLAFVSLVAPAIAMGNRVVVTPSQHHPLAACDLYQVFDTSDVPGGVVNIVTGDRDQLAAVKAKHDDIAACWYFGSADGSAAVEKESSGNLKATWVNHGKARDWYDPMQGQGEEFLFHATRIKSIWTPYGV
ncbi:aldehyde dehydrogenase family protein [Nitratireductor mangrovi]|uniref:Aldehyde dehydrogenase family protein n=1 Tax=Nitratireductor mangrovi TaxID=2599600 RepID=A0A5B8KYH8_9HYPH|nr:aldehyde dehydrogenase family protein [Nitratireductor mangrovi]QDZ00774.1 aldehyde dehydrogenase family protein [Nitratireductor mangrovi]